jgi:hypothetical protein
MAFFRKNSLESLFFAMISTAFVAYIFARAKFVPVTIDEVSTVLNHTVRNVWDIIFYQKEAVPNNHVLNTLLINFTTWLLGTHQVTVRLPAILGGILYLWAARKIAIMSDSVWLRIFVVTILLCNPFVVEFFALARGYGLSIGCMLASIAFVLQYIKSPSLSPLLFSLFWAFLSVESSFTLLNYVIPFVPLIILTCWKNNRTYFWRDSSVVLIGFGVIAFFCYQPIMKMQANNEFQFWGNNGFYTETLLPLVKASTFGHEYPYFGAASSTYLCWMIILFSIGSVITAMILWKKGHWVITPNIWLYMIFFGTITYNLAQFYVLKVPFLNSRTALFFYPLFALQLIAVANWLWEKKQWIAKIYIVLFTLFVVDNMDNNMNIRSSREWWFDSSTFLVIEHLEQIYREEQRNSPITLDIYWAMLNSFTFHIKESTPNHQAHINLSGWHPNRTYPRDTEFYLAESQEEAKQYSDTHEIDHVLDGHIQVLLRRKKQ